MKNTTLCYIERGGRVLMLHRVKKENDLNHDKWIGVGGKFEDGESPDECLLREVREETGLTLLSWRCRGVVTFLSDRWEGEYMYLFTADGFCGELAADCPEGTLEWVEKSRVRDLPTWAGDAIFLRLLEENRPFFLLTLEYRARPSCAPCWTGRRLKCEKRPCGRALNGRQFLPAEKFPPTCAAIFP